MLKDILAISGKPGLYRLVSSANNSLIVETLDATKRFPVFTSSQVSALQDIAIYTDREEVAFEEVMKNMYKKLEGKECAVVKGKAADLEQFMEEVLPNYDKDRVYTSDMKKIFSWYNILLKNHVLKIAEASEEKEA